MVSTKRESNKEWEHKKKQGRLLSSKVVHSVRRHSLTDICSLPKNLLIVARASCPCDKTRIPLPPLPHPLPRCACWPVSKRMELGGCRRPRWYRRPVNQPPPW